MSARLFDQLLEHPPRRCCDSPINVTERLQLREQERQCGPTRSTDAPNQRFADAQEQVEDVGHVVAWRSLMNGRCR
jgi:hypothetical protein